MIRICPLTIAIALLVGALPAPVRPQSHDVETLHAGDGRIDGRRIPAYTHAWQSYRLGDNGSRHAVAVWYDTVSVVQRDGREILRRVQRIVRADGATTVLVNEAERVTLLPIRTSARPADGEPFIDLSFDGARVSGRRMLLPHDATPADQVPVELALELPEPLHDWRWWGLLIAALPLEADYAARFLALATETEIESPLIWITARVIGEDAVGRVPCWIVEVEAGAPWTLWIARSREDAPVQRIQIEQPGGIMLWEPLG